MNPFSYRRAQSADEAVCLAQDPGAMFIAGGTNLLDLVKGGVAVPLTLIDVSRLPLAEIAARPDGGVRIGAMATLTEVADHTLIRDRYPLLAQALLAGATPQLRNMATVGGNLMQRTRCYYFYDAGFDRCNKRLPGSGCAAREGYNRIHAILGASDACIATHPSDMCVALAALDAVVIVRTLTGERTIPIGDFHRLPGNVPERDTTLNRGELITAVDLPPSPLAAHACYLKVRDRASYAFALVSVAAALAFDPADAAVIAAAALALGGVAHKPWRRPEAEARLVGQPLDDASIGAAADALLAGTAPYRHNHFKVDLARRAIARALLSAAGRQ